MTSNIFETRSRNSLKYGRVLTKTVYLQSYKKVNQKHCTNANPHPSLTWKNTGKLKFASFSSWRLQWTKVSSRSSTSVSVPGVLLVRIGRAGTFVRISDRGGRCLMNMYGSNSKATSCWSSLSVSVHSCRGLKQLRSLRGVEWGSNSPPHNSCSHLWSGKQRCS